MKEMSHYLGGLSISPPAIDYNSQLAIPGFLAFKKSSKMAEG